MKFIFLKKKELIFLLFLFICFALNFLIYFNVTAQTKTSLKTSAPIYQNPFDLASGGASLTRATQEGVMFSNPSLPAFGEGYFRWIFYRNTLSVADGTISAARDVMQTGTSNTTSLATKIIKDAFQKPIYVGLESAADIITSNFGIAGFASSKLDLNGQQYGTVGVPLLQIKNNSFAGVATTMSTTLSDYFAIGIGPKYIYNSEVNTSLTISEASDPTLAVNKVTSSLKKGNGLAADIGFTGQFRTKNFDLRLASVVADAGNTTFTGGLAPWLQTYNVGVGFALHDFTNAIHCALDYRDITDVYEEDRPKKIYMGCKLLITRIFGFGFGYLQGWPSYGAVLNLFLFRLEAGVYSRDLANQSGLVSQKIYFVSLGFEI